VWLARPSPYGSSIRTSTPVYPGAPSIAYQNKKVVYGILFRATAETLSTIAADPKHLGAEIGFFAVLHSWGQTLVFHPHLHCVVAGGGISLDGTRWICCRPRFFLPVQVLSRLFRRLFLQYLQEVFDSGKLRFFSSLAKLQDPQAFDRHLEPVRNLKWVVYAKPPFAGPQQVVNYVGRYTHRVAISNHRIVDIEGGEVKFTWRDYRHNNEQKTMTLSADQFIGRFLLHVLPNGFHRIRYYGFLANPHRQEKLEQCRQLLGVTATRESSSDPATLEDYRDRYERLTSHALRECPICHRGRMIAIQVLPKLRSSPAIQDTS
jgi:hypothetical protein